MNYYLYYPIFTYLGTEIFIFPVASMENFKISVYSGSPKTGTVNFGKFSNF